MSTFLQVLCVVLVAVGMGLSLAHALEFPGKLRLPKDEYMIVQSIYYPGFTIGGMFGEVGAILATAVLAIVTPFGSTEFLLVLAGLVALVIGHIVYWVVIQPINKVWLKTRKLGPAGAAFFAAGRKALQGKTWAQLRKRWEYAHISRAVLAVAGFTAIATAVAL